jgi:hypothetical protein
MVRRRIPELDQAGIAQGDLGAMVDLRFDRVVIELVANVRDAVEAAIPDTRWVMFTTTAPIRKPSRVEAFLVAAIRDQLALGQAPMEQVATFEGNDLRIRLLPHRPGKAPKLMGFVHNPTPRSGEFLDALQQTFEQA